MPSPPHEFLGKRESLDKERERAEEEDRGKGVEEEESTQRKVRRGKRRGEEEEEDGRPGMEWNEAGGGKRGGKENPLPSLSPP